MGLLSAEDCPSVRAALDTRLTSQALPDDVILLPIYAGAAESRISEEIPGVVNDPVPDPGVIRAAIYLTAALMCPFVTSLVNIRVPGLSSTFSQVDWEARQRTLMSSYRRELSVSTSQETESLQVFYRAPGGRVR